MTDWGALESKWRARWKGTEAAPVDASRPKKFITVAYPYPNSPQHIGHGRTYTLADVHARFERMRGNNVLFPMAFHYTGTPILGMAERIESGDAGLISSLVELYGVPRETVPEFADPVRIASYFHEEIKSGMIEMGYSIDWSGEFTTIDPAYKKFVAWQTSLLRKRGVIVQGSHPVGWCPRDANPVSQHDTVGDVEPDFVEYAIVQAELDDGTILPAATMRPETVHGVTNMWVNPKTEYCRVLVGEKTWLVSGECAEKLGHLACGAKRIEGNPVAGAELVGRIVRIPGIDRTVPVLPAAFVRGTTGTGAVMSVPAHAPYDYQALEDLKASDPAGPASAVEPIQILSSKEEGAPPAARMVAGAGVSDQLDARLEELTKKLYAAEYYDSVMLENTGRHAGMRASDAKAEAAKWLAGLSAGGPEAMYEFSNAPITCRCGTGCVVHVLADQWFLNYADPEWKKTARRCLEQIEIVPPDMRPEFEHVFGWLRERACARQRGLGTALPWDEGWTVESLSDSVIYMSYYLVSRFVKAGRVDPDSLDDAFFDYVFFGDGDPAKMDASYGAGAGTLQEIRAAFEYFYPVDSRHSGRDLVPNHLSFFMFNHAIIFPEKDWPRQIVVNGSVLMDGKKMSKSMSNIIPLRQAVRKYGADPIRLAIISSAELLQDADFKLDLVHSASSRLESMLRECARIAGRGGSSSGTPADAWLAARMREVSSDVAGLIEKMRLREAVRHVFSEVDSILGWYSERADAAESAAPALREAWSVRAALLSPFAPHAADEMWEVLGNEGTASGSAWPRGAEGGADAELLCSESLLESVMGDIRHILDVTKISPTKITVYAADDQKSRAYGVMLDAAQESADMSSMMRALGADKSTAGMRGNADFVKRSLADILSATERDRRLRRLAGGIDEAVVYRSSLAGLVKRAHGVDLDVYAESDPDVYDPKNKARTARPFKPAILIE